MKPVLFSIHILLLLLTADVQAQRRLPGQQTVQATVGPVDGFSKKSFHTGVALSRFTKNSNRWTFGAEYLHKEFRYQEQPIPVEQLTGEAGFFLSVLSDRSKTFFVTAGLSGMLGYELVNRDKSLLYDGSSLLPESKFLCGGALSFEIEAWPADRVILLAGFRQRVLPGSAVSKFHNQLLIGIKFVIN
ncbi:MAG: conjugal transfer protein TraO [Bacteroidales bacterium]|jgi:hypothetical protein|nr:conjugal transfer protein TraO [Bacteroidales bacterium]